MCVFMSLEMGSAMADEVGCWMLIVGWLMLELVDSMQPLAVRADIETCRVQEGRTL